MPDATEGAGVSLADYWALAGIYLLAVLSPGPSTIAIAATAMGAGRRVAMAQAGGVVAGSLMWSVAAATGLGAVLRASPVAFEALKAVGAIYLLYLAARSAAAAVGGRGAMAAGPAGVRSRAGAFRRGFALHLANPKAVLFWGALFTAFVGPSAAPLEISRAVAMCATICVIVLTGYAALFSSAPATAAYLRFGRWIDGAVAAAFAAAGLGLIAAQLGAA